MPLIQRVMRKLELPSGSDSFPAYFCHPTADTCRHQCGNAAQRLPGRCGYCPGFLSVITSVVCLGSQTSKPDGRAGKYAGHRG